MGESTSQLRATAVPPSSVPTLPSSSVTLRGGTWSVIGGLLLIHTSDVTREDPEKENVLPDPTAIQQQENGL